MNILVGIAAHRPSEAFLRDYKQFFDIASKKYTMDEFWVYDRTLVEAQNLIAEHFMGGNYTHLLMLEDDHSGHSLEMLDKLVQADKLVCAISYYSRHGHMPKVPMMKRKDKYIEGHFESGTHEVDLVGFGFTLIKKRAFERVGKPYFKLNDYECMDKSLIRSTDRDWET